MTHMKHHMLYIKAHILNIYNLSKLDEDLYISSLGKEYCTVVHQNQLREITYTAALKTAIFSL